ncbi:MAG TPA: alpha/beta hydrolase, partial [Candidatus Limnocylindria bacterium]|nr:alpha/beta hydrolase [Candidatus Limnocylindria bacterium]
MSRPGLSRAGHVNAMGVPRAFDRATAIAAATASAVAAASADTPALLLNAVVPGEGYTVAKRIAYGADPRQHLDVYVPSERSDSVPVLAFFYGGSWKTGKRSYYRFIGEAFASRGYMVVVPDYRLYPSVRFPEFVEDGARALKWIEQNAS